MALAPQITAVDELLFRSPLVCIGRFECPREHPLFVDSGPASAHLFVFPRSSVRIRHVGREPFATSRNVVTFYNPGDEYRREPLSPEGDRCDWFALAPELAREVVRDMDPRAADDPKALFGFDHGPSDAPSYLEQRLTRNRAASPGHRDPLFVEETVVRLLARLLRGAYARRSAVASPSSRGTPLRPAQRDRVEAAREVLGKSLGEPLSLDEVARASGTSAFHLCRIFKRATGLTLHAYRHQLRLRLALDLVAERTGDLTGVALDLGFSSHSHFTRAFREAFFLTPAEFRRRLGEGGARPIAQKPAC